MARLPKYTLSFDRKKQDWRLENDATDRVVRRFDTKAEATKGGVLEKAVGSTGGSVKIEKKKGGYDEERTYPRSRDPRESKG
ncbi:MAG: DUF2188 domain-containing protein [Thermoanaerobaculia bacterium]